MPPQSRFSCAPCSIRTRVSKDRSICYTYACTEDNRRQIVLFKDVLEGQRVETQHVTSSHFPGNVFALRHLVSRTSDEMTCCLLVIVEDGQLLCLDGDNLSQLWSSSTKALKTGTHENSGSLQVEHAQLDTARRLCQGMLRDRPDIIATFQRSFDAACDPNVLILVTKSTDEPSTESRTIHCLSLPGPDMLTDHGVGFSAQSIFAVKLPQHEVTKVNSSHIDLATGTLHQLSTTSLDTYDMIPAVPKVLSRISIKGARSFIHLSNTALLVSFDNHVKIYNPVYNSVVGILQIGAMNDTPKVSTKRKRSSIEHARPLQKCQLVASFPKLGLVSAISGSSLIAFHTGGSALLGGRRDTTGLLIDSLGCPIDDNKAKSFPKHSGTPGMTSMRQYMPGSLGNAEKSFADQIKHIDTLATKGHMNELDELLRTKLGLTDVEPSHDALPQQNNSSDCKITKQSSPDRRWVIYTISKIFSIHPHEDGSNRLEIVWCPERIFDWLLETGNLSKTNVETALRDHARNMTNELIPPGELIRAIAECDTKMRWLLKLLKGNFLPPIDILHAIRHLMSSLDLITTGAPPNRLLSYADDQVNTSDADIDAQIERAGAEVEEQISLAESRLGLDAALRGQALSTALLRLYRSPVDAVVAALKTFSHQDVLSLIYLLRIELVRGSWTSKYMESDSWNHSEEDIEVEDNAAVLVASLLNACVDAIGPSGWLSDNTTMIGGDLIDSSDFIAGLKLEITAALDGIEDVAYLKGLVSEIIRFGHAIQKGQPTGENLQPTTRRKRPNHKTQPITLPTVSQENSILPLGLKTESQISQLRIGAGGEVKQRSGRDIGRLKSHNVGDYTLERIVI